jgi:hypothetical protein
MKPNPAAGPAQPQTSRRYPLVLAGVAFVAGVALAGVWFHRHASGPETGGLPVATRNLLGQLPAPVTIRYYTLLPAGSADETLQAFGGRVAQLLDTVQSAGDGKVQVITIDAPAETNITAATADGIQPFNLDKGDACFLGLTISSGGHKESLARLQPEWEAALPYDIVRAILSVATPAAPAPPAPEVAKPSPEIISSIKRLIPDVNATSVEDADQIFHDDFVSQCSQTGAELEAQINAAAQQVVQAQKSGSESDLQAARQHLHQVQLAQGEKLKQLAADLQTELAVFQQMKAGITNAAK